MTQSYAKAPVAASRLAAGLATVTALVAGAVYTQTSGFGFNLSKIANGFYSSVLALLSPDNNNAAVYSFISAGLGIYSSVLLFGPHEVRGKGKERPHLAALTNEKPGTILVCPDLSGEIDTKTGLEFAENLWVRALLVWFELSQHGISPPSPPPPSPQQPLPHLSPDPCWADPSQLCIADQAGCQSEQCECCSSTALTLHFTACRNLCMSAKASKSA